MRKINRAFLLLIFSSAAFFIKAQSNSYAIPISKNDKIKDSLSASLKIGLAFEYQYINPDKGILYADSAIKLANQISDQSQLAQGYLSKAENYCAKKDGQSALPFVEKALAINRQKNYPAGLVASLNDMGRAYCYIPGAKDALGYFDQALSLNKYLQSGEQEASIFSNMAWYYMTRYDFKNAVEYFKKALVIYEKSGSKKDLARIMTYTGKAYFKMSDFATSTEYLLNALHLNKQLDYSAGIAYSCYCLGGLYYIVNPNIALGYYQTALTIYELLDAPYHQANILNDIGSVHSALSDSGRITEHHQKARNAYLKSLELNEKIHNKWGIALNLGNLGFNYICSADFANALACLKKSSIINKELDDKYQLADNLETIAIIYYSAPDKEIRSLDIDPLTRYEKAIDYMKSALVLSTEVGNTVQQTWELLRLHEIYIKINRYDSAYKYYRQFFIIRDSVFNVHNEAGIIANELRYDFARKEDSLKFNQQLSDEKLKQQVLFARQQEQQLIIRKKELDLSNRERDLQKLAFLKTQSDLQNEQLEKEQKNKLLIISEKEKQLGQANVKTLKQEQKLNVLKQERLWFYIAGILILIAAASFYFYYRTHLQEGNLKAEIAFQRMEKENKEAEFQRRLGDISLSALRSQMNPHFIFNCLNSIKLYTTQNDTMAASDYLTKFSRLIRLVLENSRNDRISLASELDALRLYIEMEAMRFKEKLQYDISVEKNVDMDYIEIPPLLLQPYVENAIWHGLMQKEEGGRIDIHVGIQPGESMLLVTITDNGIGRARSKELMSKTATKHKSYGMKVTSERLALINQVYKTGTDVIIDDLMDKEGHPAGTKVTIQIPLE